MTRWIYLHGFASSPASKKARFFQQRFLEIGVPLEIPDLNGANFEDLTLTGQLAQVTETARADPIALIGSSMGGYLAALYAARHPEVERVVLMAPAFDFCRRWSERLGPAEYRDWRESGYLNLFHYGDAAERRVSWNLMEDAAKYEAYPDVQQPSLIFHGRNDDVVPVAASEEFARRTPTCRLRLMDSDHELINVLEEMWREVQQFTSVTATLQDL